MYHFYAMDFRSLGMSSLVKSFGSANGAAPQLLISRVDPSREGKQRMRERAIQLPRTVTTIPDAEAP